MTEQTLKFEDYVKQYSEAAKIQKTFNQWKEEGEPFYPNAANLAVGYAKSDISPIKQEMQDKARQKQFVDSRTEVPKTLNTFYTLFRSGAKTIYESAKDAVLNSIPVKRLAEKYWEINPVGVPDGYEGSPDHNIIASDHLLGRSLEGLLKDTVENKKGAQKNLEQAAEATIVQDSIKKVSENKIYQNNVKAYAGLIAEWAVSVINSVPDLTKQYIARKAGDFKQAVDKALGSDERKAAYALANMRYSDDSVVEGIYLPKLASNDSSADNIQELYPPFPLAA